MSKTSAQFYANTDLTPEQTAKLVKEGLRDADYGEFYQELRTVEAISIDKGLFTVSSNFSSGFGFRYGQEQRVGYTHSAVFNKNALTDAISRSRQVRNGAAGTQKLEGYGKGPVQLYPKDVGIGGMTLEQKIQRISEIEAYVKSQDPRIDNVSVSYAARKSDVHIITADGKPLKDERPRLGLFIGVTLKQNDKREQSTGMHGGPITLEELFDQTHVARITKSAIEKASLLLKAEEAPAGTMDIVLSPGWSGIILHEAVGHGLEGDFNRRDISVYSGKIGQRVASKGVTIIDQGNIVGSRGAIHFDDEGMPGQKNILVENGILVKYMQDRQNALLMGVEPTGNGRRENYTYTPMPRMTNTYFANGEYTPDEITASVNKGIYVDSFSNGQVDITSGEFNMNAELCYPIENGKVLFDRPFKGATLMGEGHKVIKAISMIGNNLEIPREAGMCGKDSQTVPVGVGQPTIKVRKVKVGGLKQ